MEILYLYFILLFAHWFGDFIVQTHWQATNKSKNMFALGAHTYTYSTVMTIAFALGLAGLGITVTYLEYVVLGFFLLTFISHGLTDLVTSKFTSKFWEEKRMKTFFSMVGFDQLLHQYTIILTILWLVG